MPCAPWLVSRGISSIAIHLDRRAAFHRMLAEWREIFPLLELCPYIFGDDERVAEVLGEAFDARSSVHGIADHRVFVPVVGADMADDHLAHVQADADRKRLEALRLETRVQPVQPYQHVARCGYRAA